MYICTIYLCRSSFIPPFLNPQSHNQATNPSMTPTSPTPIPAISRPPVAPPLPVAEAVAAEFVADTVARFNTWPKVGSGTSPFTAHPLTVAVGHAGAFLEGV